MNRLLSNIEKEINTLSSMIKNREEEGYPTSSLRELKDSLERILER